MSNNPRDIFTNYSVELSTALLAQNWANVHSLADKIAETRKNNNRVFLCGNGGSAANAIHIANDLVYAVTNGFGGGIDAVALCANQAVMTCLANDIDYGKIFSEQLSVSGRKNDLLIVLSGSGNSRNIVNVLKKANEMDIHTAGIFGFDGGESLKFTKSSIHFEINNMQVIEDLQLIVGHMIMKYLGARLYANK